MATQTMKTFTPLELQGAARAIVLPLVAFALFLWLWSLSAARIETSLGQVPGPVAVWGQAANLVAEHRAERVKEQAFYERQEKRNQAKLAEDPDAKVRIRPYTGKPTFFDQILTSLWTVFSGFILASILFTLGWIDGSKGTPINALKDWAFTFAFVGMGLELSINEFKMMGWRPVAVFLIVTVFNTVLALGVAWVIFTQLLPLGV